MCCMWTTLQPDRVGSGTWLQVACTPLPTAFHVPSRGRAPEFGILPSWLQVCVHDALSVYDQSARPKSVHAWCGVHVVRDPVAAEEARPGRNEPPSQSCIAPGGFYQDTFAVL